MIKSKNRTENPEPKGKRDEKDFFDVSSDRNPNLSLPSDEARRTNPK